MKKRNWIIAAALSATLFLSACYAAAWLLIPARGSFGSTWESYLQEPENSIDVLFFGSSLTYCNIVPAVIYEETGVTTYLMAGSEQTLPLSYSYIREACRTQSPKLVALEITGMFYPRYCNFTKVNVTYMPWSANRVQAIFTGAEPELRAGLLFPILDYHSRWREISRQEIADRFHPQTDPLAGYTFLDSISPQSQVTVRDYSAETENYARNLEYLSRIAEFCEDKGMELMLFITPTKGRIPEDALETLRTDAAALGLEIRDFNEDMDTLAIDDNSDWFDFLHFNYRGAEKFSRVLSDHLISEYTLTSTQNEDEPLWRQRAEHFAALLPKE